MITPDDDIRDNVTENAEDEADILADTDETLSTSPNFDDGDITSSYQHVEDEPARFVRGEVDVKTQMDRVTEAMSEDLQGLSQRSSREDDRIPNP